MDAERQTQTDIETKTGAERQTQTDIETNTDTEPQTDIKTKERRNKTTVDREQWTKTEK